MAEAAGEEEAQESPSCSLQPPEKGCGVGFFPQANNDRKACNGLRLRQGRLELDMRRISSLEWQNIWNGWGWNPWKSWRDGWVWHLVLWFGWQCGDWSRVGLHDVGGPFQPWWFCESMKYVIPLISWVDKSSLGAIRKGFLLDEVSTSVWCLSFTVTLQVWAGSVVPGRPLTFHVSLKQPDFAFLYKYTVCGEWTKPSSAFYSQFRLLRERRNYL